MLSKSTAKEWAAKCDPVWPLIQCLFILTCKCRHNTLCCSRETGCKEFHHNQSPLCPGMIWESRLLNVIPNIHEVIIREAVAANVKVRWFSEIEKQLVEFKIVHKILFILNGVCQACLQQSHDFDGKRWARFLVLKICLVCTQHNTPALCAFRAHERSAVYSFTHHLRPGVQLQRTALLQRLVF